MSILDNLREGFRSWLGVTDPSDESRREMATNYSHLLDYFRGKHKKPLKTKPLQADDNLIVNLAGLVVDRNVSLLFGKGVQFDLESEGDSPEQEHIDAVWKANKKAILLHDVAEFGSVFGTCFVKFLPDALEADGKMVPRLVALDPALLEIEADPEDKDWVTAYEIEYGYMVGDQKVLRRERTEMGFFPGEAAEGEPVPMVTSWVVRRYEKTSLSGSKWDLIEETIWPYPFPPIHHWKNLPAAGSCYGRSDLSEDVIALQDGVNFVASNINKILRYHAHPKTWGRGFGTMSRASWGADEMITLPDAEGAIQNLEMSSDLASSAGFLQFLRQVLFDISRTVDLSSMADKLGALTNFGLRVLFKDSLDKLGTKRELYGDALVEINRRLLVLAEIGEDGGSVNWPEPLPVDEFNQAQTVQVDLGAGIVDKQTAAEKRGYNWEVVKGRLANQQAAGDSVGAAILRAFSQGK
ncbi:MAG: phage portal protein [Methyloceanibacter sp.]|nr:phage portal protein [Methyloceanibacter sp.]